MSEPRMKYRMKKSEVEAIQWDGESGKRLKRIVSLTNGKALRVDGRLLIETGDRAVVAYPHNWIVKDDDGVIDVIGDGNFRRRFVPVDG